MQSAAQCNPRGEAAPEAAPQRSSSFSGVRRVFSSFTSGRRVPHAFLALPRSFCQRIFVYCVGFCLSNSLAGEGDGIRNHQTGLHAFVLPAVTPTH